MQIRNLILGGLVAVLLLILSRGQNLIDLGNISESPPTTQPTEPREPTQPTNPTSQQVDYDTVTIEANRSSVGRYSLEAQGGEFKPKANINPDDSILGERVAGGIGGGSDMFKLRSSAEIIADELPAGATVKRNGNIISQNNSNPTQPTGDDLTDTIDPTGGDLPDPTDNASNDDKLPEYVDGTPVNQPDEPTGGYNGFRSGWTVDDSASLGITGRQNLNYRAFERDEIESYDILKSNSGFYTLRIETEEDGTLYLANENGAHEVDLVTSLNDTEGFRTLNILNEKVEDINVITA